MISITINPAFRYSDWMEDWEDSQTCHGFLRLLIENLAAIHDLPCFIRFSQSIFIMKKASTLPTLLLLIWGLVGLNPLFSQTFSQLGQDIAGTENSDGFGSSISLSQSGARLAVGASFHNLQKGLVRVYEFDANLNQWNQLGQDLNGIQHGSRFGFRVSLSSDGNRVAIGAPYYEQSQPLQGMIQILEYNPTTQLWEQDRTVPGRRCR